MPDEPRKPTLLVLASTYPRWPGDHEPGFVHALCRRLTDRFEVVVLTSRSPGAAPSEVLDGVEVVRYRYAPQRIETLVYGGGIAAHLERRPWKLLLVPGFILGQYLAARRLMKRRRIDLLHAHWLIPQGMIARWLVRHVASVPFVMTSHGGDLFGLRGPWLQRIKREVASASAAMTVVSEAMRQEVGRLGLRSPRLEVLPMGVDMCGRFTPDDTITRCPEEILFVGRLVPKKGLSYLLDAMPAVLAQRPGAVLAIAGFGPEQEALQAQVARLDIEASVCFLGAFTQADLPALYRRAALLVAPFVRDTSGNQEGLPVVLMEAIGCGCPVVAGNVAGVQDLLDEHADRVCVNATDTSALAEAILRVLAHPAEARERALSLREALARRVDWHTIARGYADLLESCLAGAVGAVGAGSGAPRRGYGNEQTTQAGSARELRPRSQP
ncbi:MAG: glycosyltransferase [Nitrococcus mobilis]|nr:glycosyltransferase [Nitrococcus mobilis]